MRTYTMTFTGDEYYTIIDLLDKYSSDCLEQSEKEYPNMDEAWNKTHREVSRECAISAGELASRMRSNARYHNARWR